MSSENSTLKPIEELIGKRIVKAKIKGIRGCDDKPYLILEMEDGSIFKITSWYGGWNGKSDEEYPRFIGVDKYVKK